MVGPPPPKKYRVYQMNKITTIDKSHKYRIKDTKLREGQTTYTPAGVQLDSRKKYYKALDIPEVGGDVRER